MNVDEAASALGITPSTVRGQIEKGVIGAIKRDGRWDIPPADVEVYRASRLGQRSRSNLANRSATFEAMRLEGLRSPETKAKMRAAKVGRRLTPEHIDKVRAALSARVIRPETREKHRQRQLGVPKSPAHRLAIAEASRRPEVRAKRSATMVERYLSGKRPYSRLERQAANLLLPLGFVRFPQIDSHAFDFGSSDGSALVEVNGCGVHWHRTEKQTCPTSPHGRGPNLAYRDIAARHGRRLVELWACERKHWPDLI